MTGTDVLERSCLFGELEFNGLPLHILIVHAVVVGIPLAALLTVLSAVWPAARRRLGIVTPIVALFALVGHRSPPSRPASGCRRGSRRRR